MGAASQQKERPHHLCFLFPQQLKLRPLPNMQGRLWCLWFSVPSPRLAGSGNLKKNNLHCKMCLNRSWSHPWPTTGVPGSSTAILSPGFSSCWLYVNPICEDGVQFLTESQLSAQSQGYGSIAVKRHHDPRQLVKGNICLQCQRVGP